MIPPDLVLLLLLLLLGWLWIWGECWNPLRTSCFLQPDGHGDPVQHYLGWRAYAAASPGSLIPPLINRWTWPNPVPLIYADSIPLAAILMRPVQQLVGRDFQYFSLVSIVSVLATGVLGHRIGQVVTGSRGCAFCLGLSLGLAPPMVMRLFSHEALSLQLFIIWPLALLIGRDGRFWPWALLLALVSGVHPYGVALVLPLLLIRLLSPECPPSALAVNLGERMAAALAVRLPPRVLEGLLQALVLAVAMLVYGYGSGEMDTAPAWAGSWSANVLSLLDSANLSPIVPPIGKHEPFQVEGVAYPGLFVILSAPLLWLLGRRRQQRPRGLFPSPPLFWGVLVLMLVFAWGSTWYVGPQAVLDLSALRDQPVLGLPWRTLRASGRFVWPLYYALMIWTFCRSWTLFRSRSWRIVLLVVVLLSLVESHSIPMQAAHNHFQWRQRPLKGSSAPVPALLADFARRPGSAVINVTADPLRSLPQVPSMALQRVAPALITNHAPHLARYPRHMLVATGADDCRRLATLIEQHAAIAERAWFIAESRRIQGCQPQPGWRVQQVLDLPPDHQLVRLAPCVGARCRQSLSDVELKSANPR